MTDTTKPLSQEERMSSLAPEMHNDEQDDHRSQAQEIAMQAKEHAQNAGATESLKVASPGVDNVAGSETDMIDQMREMEDTGRIDNGAFAGEPNHDDNVDKYYD
ncbi:hypothetical protein CD351_01090 [Erythrobacter sp. KY5]|uniref:hypothetical protein n=1 Tax=Erythrobacter sp. KY5 TaxID=2011159 RepID=UPI000DBF0A3A|nr:hypothetical protein [Erythrobacter sp. KY5]AWW73016.1 hypothetical protein CD351_01090 [Erythrobacter sp. KY5]